MDAILGQSKMMSEKAVMILKSLASDRLTALLPGLFTSKALQPACIAALASERKKKRPS